MSYIFFITNQYFLILIASLIALWLIYSDRKIDAWGIVIGSILVSIVTLWLKDFFAISRPDDALFNVSGYAFPSWHASFILFLVVMIYFLFIRYRHSKKIKLFLDTLCILIGLGIGYSRIWFKVHTLNDVLFGYLIGFFVALIILFIGYKYKKSKE
jgi:membrane-associated phospholipid phosphatase